MTDSNHTITIVNHKSGTTFTYNIPIDKAVKVMKAIRRILEPDTSVNEARGSLAAMFND